MKKFILFIAFGCLLISPTAVIAASTSTTGLGSALSNLNKTTGGSGLSSSLESSLGSIIQAALSLVGTIFLILTVYAGILWMTAQGKEEQVEKAGKIIKASVIGLFIVMSAYAITYFVTSRLGGSQKQSSGCYVTTLKACVKGVDSQSCSAVYGSGAYWTGSCTTWK